MPFIKTNEQGYVTYLTMDIRYLPVEFTAELTEVPLMPAPIQEPGKVEVLKYDATSKELFYEYQDRPPTTEEKVKQLEEQTLSASARYEELKKNTPTLAQLQEGKVNVLKEACSEAIYAGFTSGTNEFGFNETDQSNFTQRMLTIVAGAVGPFQWKSKNNGVVELTADEFKQAVTDAEAHKLVQQQKYWTLEQQVIAATTKEEVDAVIW